MNNRATMFVPAEILLQAVDRVGAGLSVPLARWDNMSLSAAQSLIREAVEELFILRAEHREWLCTSCSTLYPQSTSTCPKCQKATRPHGVIKEAAYKARIRDLELQIERLESSLEAVLDLGTNNP